jgi:hypothetical protein
MKKNNDYEYSTGIKFRSLLFLGTIIVIGFAVLVLGVWIGIPDKNIIEILSTVSVSVGGSVIAAALVGFSLIYYREFGERKKRKDFLTFVGIKKPTDKVAIILPRIPNGCTENKDLACTNNSSTPKRNNAIKDSRITNRYCLAFDDIVAVRHITSIFVKFGLKPPRIEFDDDTYDYIFENAFENSSDPKLVEIHKRFESFNSFISIGLFSSYVTTEFANRRNSSDKRSFKLSDEKSFFNGIRKVSICPEEDDVDNWRKSTSVRWYGIKADITKPFEHLAEQKDFSLIAKCKTPKGKSCLIIGGGKSRGTRKAASFLRKNWESVFNYSDYRGEKKIRDNGSFQNSVSRVGRPRRQRK